MINQDLVVAIFLLLTALVTGLANKFGRWYISMPMVFVVAGFLLGPVALDLTAYDSNPESLLAVAELTLALILFTDASTLSARQVQEDTLLPGRLLLIGLPLTIILGGLIGFVLFPGLPIGYALLIGAILAPTDASLGLPIFTNKKVPVRIRRALNIESGLNDGLASPLVILFLGLTLAEEGVALGDWLTTAVAELVLAALVGLAVGFVAGRFLHAAVSRKWTSDMYSKLAIFAVALACYYLSLAVGGNGFVAAFVGGIVFGHFSRHDLAEETEFAEAGGTLLSLLVWTATAAAFAGPEIVATWRAFDGRVIVYALLSLTVVRMLPVAISMIGTGLQRETVLLMGWFGPRGLASVVFGLLATSALLEGNAPQEPLAAAVVTTVMLSVFAHGLSAQPLVNWYARRIGQNESADKEMQEMPELTRRPRTAAPRDA